MYKLAIAAWASAWLVGAQVTDDDLYHPHASFAFIRTGERTPTIQPGPSVLTALGAQQMYKLGQNFRTRYIAGNADAGLLGVQRIAGMSQNLVNNDQILVQTLDQQHLVSSAQAFMQGLYPPRNTINSLGSSNGTGASTGGLLANGTAIDFPLGGYQYANIQSSGQLDPESIYISGIQNCPIAQRDALRYFTTDSFAQTQAATADFYKRLSPEWFGGNLRRDQLEFAHAIEINDYLQYQYAHNSSIYRTLSNDTSFDGVFSQVRTLADEEAWSLYGNTSTSSTDTDNQAIAGKTLASVVLGAFQRIIADRLSPGDPTDISYPMTLLFGEQEPFISLMSLMMVDFRDSAFRSIPPFGSAMIFELFSTGRSAAFPTSPKDLRVRFHFHNGTSYDNNQLTAFPMFGNGPNRTDMAWPEFQDLFSRIMMPSLSQWCETCASPSLFCWGVDENNITLQLPAAQGKRHAVSPAVGGVIGAVVTLVVAGLLFGLAMLLGGVRLHRVQRSKKSELGGFKGSSKLASDPDLSLAKNGAPPAGISFVSDAKRGHERVGSWELRQKEFGTDLADQSRRSSFDAIDAVASKPVQADERV
ncbi:phosphoglycerate mutase-like protein [Ophiobolus disseminans]|uniref:Phosphoglycerate mutase-like protein n=1 Tax=Ophiobolus disseminans TaxID=1469910 RepID=A0A6A7AJX8_9PLEO|nr:phosphoglycerate mutase-like protein [Ophiobolus disseminans]